MTTTSLQGNIFDIQAGREAKERGMRLAAVSKNPLLDMLREALTIQALYGPVSADDAYFWLAKEGYESTVLGKAAGSIFVGPNSPFEWTGEFVQSQRATNNGRYIRTWRLR